MVETFFGASMVVMSNIGSAVVLILINKRVVTLHKFRFMSVLSGIHFYFSFITCLILLGFGLIHYKPVNNYLHLLRIALVSSDIHIHIFTYTNPYVYTYVYVIYIYAYVCMYLHVRICYIYIYI
jgi:hypothetical protein